MHVYCIRHFSVLRYTLDMNTKSNSQAFLTESHQPTPVIEQADIVVCGGGPAGVAAALGAARMQKQLGQTPSVRLLELHGQWAASGQQVC